jgi:hypothetical protein
MALCSKCRAGVARFKVGSSVLCTVCAFALKRYCGHVSAIKSAEKKGGVKASEIKKVEGKPKVSVQEYLAQLRNQEHEKPSLAKRIRLALQALSVRLSGRPKAHV